MTVLDHTFLVTAQDFFGQLSRNNDRDWWQANRGTYDSVIKPGADAILTTLTPRFADLLGEEVTPKLFRPYRDTRFSKDKTPYKEHLHMRWQVQGGRDPVALFFGIEPTRVRVGGGIMGLGKPVLEDWRKFVDLDGPRVMKIVEQVEQSGFVFFEPDLLRVPRGYAPDHPGGRLLRMKSVIATRDVTLPPDQTIPDAVFAALTQFRPLIDLMISVSCA